MEKSYFFDSDNGDRKYGSTYWAEYFSSFIENGIFLKTGSELSMGLSPYGDRAFILRPGKAFINGYGYNNDSDKSIEIPESHATLNRIDSIVIQWNLSERQIRAKLRSSTPAENPTPVTPVRNAEIWELVIAEIYVGKGNSQLNITSYKDKRYDTNVCGIVTSVGQPIDTTKLNELIDKLFTRYDELEEQFEGITGIRTYSGIDTDTNISVTDNSVTPKLGDIIAVRMTNPSNDSGVQPGATLTFNGKKESISVINGTWENHSIAQYSSAVFMKSNSGWILLSFDSKSGITNKKISFPSGGNVTPIDGISFDIGEATSDVTVLSTQSGNIQITASIIFKKGSATKITVAPYYHINKNVFDLSGYTANDYVIISINNGAVSIGKSI